MTPSEQFVKEAFQHHHLSTSMDEVLIDDRLSGTFVHRPVEKERMGTNFAKLHDGIQQLHVVDFLDWNETIPLARHWERGIEGVLLACSWWLRPSSARSSSFYRFVFSPSWPDSNSLKYSSSSPSRTSKAVCFVFPLLYFALLSFIGPSSTSTAF